MRAGSDYHCPACGDRTPHPVACIRCDEGVVDEHGNPPPPLYERRILSRGYELNVESNTASGLGDLILLGSFAIKSVARRVSDSGRQRRRRKARARVPLTSIAQAEGAVVRIAGRAQVLQPADPKQPDVAFSLVRVRERGQDGSCAVETRLCCSKLVIHDGSGTAVVDDDFIAILPAEGSIPANVDASIIARDGQQVEVCGPALRRAMAGIEHAGRQGGYRREPEVLCFDGRPDALLLLRPLA